MQVLTAGRLKVSPHRLLGNGAWKSLLAKIPASYGYVIVDTPPVLAASEALVLAKHADAILICVMRDVSRGRTGAQGIQSADGRRRLPGGHGAQRRADTKLQVLLWNLPIADRTDASLSGGLNGTADGKSFE